MVLPNSPTPSLAPYVYLRPNNRKNAESRGVAGRRHGERGTQGQEHRWCGQERYFEFSCCKSHCLRPTHNLRCIFLKKARHSPLLLNRGESVMPGAEHSDKRGRRRRHTVWLAVLDLSLAHVRSVASVSRPNFMRKTRLKDRLNSAKST